MEVGCEQWFTLKVDELYVYTALPGSHQIMLSHWMCMHNLSTHKQAYLNRILLEDGAQGGSPNLCKTTEVLHKHTQLIHHMHHFHHNSLVN